MAHKIPFTLLVAGSIAYASAVSAAPGADRFPISIADAQAQAETRFTTLDADRSGAVDRDEFEAAKASRPAAHGRGMQRRGKHARSAAHDGTPRDSRRADMRTEIDTELFAIMDSDGNGTLSREEYQTGNKREARHLARKRVAFKHMDVDQDNLLTMEELARPLARLRAADTDADGMVSRDEMHAQWQQFRHRRGAG